MCGTCRASGAGQPAARSAAWLPPTLRRNIVLAACHYALKVVAQLRGLDWDEDHLEHPERLHPVHHEVRVVTVAK